MYDKGNLFSQVCSELLFSNSLMRDQVMKSTGLVDLITHLSWVEEMCLVLLLH